MRKNCRLAVSLGGVEVHQTNNVMGLMTHGKKSGVAIDPMVRVQGHM